MRVNFLLPDFCRSPSGGLKVQYELANRLADLGHDVVVYHSVNIDRNVVRHPQSIPGLVRLNWRGRRALRWFELHPSVRCRFVPFFVASLVRRADVTIFNAFAIADRIAPGSTRLGRLLEIVYEYPVWACGTPELRAQLARSLRRDDIGHVATCGAVKDMLAELGVPTVGTFHCGIDLPAAPAAIPRTSERGPVVGFPLRPEAHKGAGDMAVAIELVRSSRHDVRFECFGRDDGTVELPPGVVSHGYLRDEDVVALYRRCAVFVLPSHAEGWGLPAAEAMANGCAVVVAENGGSADFAIDGETALVVPVRDPQAIARAVCRLLDDEVLRARLVQGGMARCASMSWDRSMSELLPLLTAS